MTLTLTRPPTKPRKPAPTAAPAPWPPEAEFILSALEAAHGPKLDRRDGSRLAHRAPATLRLFSDAQAAPPWQLYCRDAAPRSLGFITRHRLPLGYGGVVHLTGPGGQPLTIHCTVRRCRETVHGWFEGSLSFNREQFAFAAEPADA